MGVKSTVDLSLEEAVAKYVDLRTRAIEEIRRQLATQARAMNKDDLEDALAVLNDTASGGEGFENYTIVAD